MATALKTRLLGTQSDERLSALAGEGSQIAFEALARRHRRALLRHCRQLCLSQETAQEVLQRSLSEAWSGIQAGAEPQDPRSWLYGIAQRIAIEQMRGAVPASAGDLTTVREAELPGRGSAASGEPTPDEVLALRSALSAMTSRRERDGIVVHRGDGDKVAEGALGIADSAVRGLIGRARRGISALTPPPLLAWALSRAAESGPSGERMAELGAGGAAGLTGLAVKGAVVALTAGVAITGAVVAQSGGRPHARVSARAAAGARSSSATGLAAATGSAGGAGAGAGSGGTDPSAGRRGGGRSGARHVLLARITSPKSVVSSGPDTQGAGGSGSAAGVSGSGSAAGGSGAAAGGSAQPSRQRPAGSSQAREVRVQTSTTVTQTASAGGGAGAGVGVGAGATVSASASAGLEGSATVSTGQSGGGKASIGVSSEPGSPSESSSTGSGSRFRWNRSRQWEYKSTFPSSTGVPAG